MKNRPCRGFTFWFPFGNARKCRARIAFAFLFVFTFRLAFGRDGVSLIFIRFSCLFHRYYDGFSNEREREQERECYKATDDVRLYWSTKARPPVADLQSQRVVFSSMESICFSYPSPRANDTLRSNSFEPSKTQ